MTSFHSRHSQSPLPDFIGEKPRYFRLAYFKGSMAVKQIFLRAHFCQNFITNICRGKIVQAGYEKAVNYRTDIRGTKQKLMADSHLLKKLHGTNWVGLHQIQMSML